MEGTIARATDAYGLFATVIGLLSWLSIAAQLILIAAELNAVRSLLATVAEWAADRRGP